MTARLDDLLMRLLLGALLLLVVAVLQPVGPLESQERELT